MELSIGLYSKRDGMLEWTSSCALFGFRLNASLKETSSCEEVRNIRIIVWIDRLVGNFQSQS